LQEKLSGAFKYRQNRLAAGAQVRIPLGELTTLPGPDPLAGGRGLAVPSPKTPPPLSALGLSSTTLWAVLTPITNYPA